MLRSECNEISVSLHERELSKAETMSYANLQKILSTLPSLMYTDRMPYAENKKDIFHAIFDNAILTDADKIAFIQALFVKGYIYHIDSLFADPEDNILFQNQSHYPLLKFLYTYVIQKYLPVDFKIEREIWATIKNHDGELKDALKLLTNHSFSYKKTHLNKISQFACDWIYSTNDQLKVISIFDKINTTLKNTDFAVLKNKIHRIAEQHILEIEFNAKPHSIQLSKQDKLNVKSFLCASSGIFHLFKSHSYHIYKMIQNKDSHALHEYQKANHKIFGRLQ